MQLGDSSSLFVYEGSAKRGYLQWLQEVGYGNDTIIRLVPRLKIAEPRKQRLKVLGDYKYLIFHSPGELLQSKFIKDVKKLKCYTIGLQHGYLPINLPCRAKFVLERSSVNLYILVQRHIADALSSPFVCVSDPPQEKNKTHPSLHGTLNVYFDAFDSNDFRRQVMLVHQFCEDHEFSVNSLRFHPSTGWFLRCITILYLRSVYNRTPNVDTHLESLNVAWLSKVKETFPRGNSFTISSDCKLVRTENVNSSLASDVRLLLQNKYRELEGK